MALGSHKRCEVDRLRTRNRQSCPCCQLVPPDPNYRWSRRPLPRFVGDSTLSIIRVVILVDVGIMVEQKNLLRLTLEVLLRKRGLATEKVLKDVQQPHSGILLLFTSRKDFVHDNCCLSIDHESWMRSKDTAHAEKRVVLHKTQDWRRVDVDKLDKGVCSDIGVVTFAHAVHRQLSIGVGLPQQVKVGVLAEKRNPPDERRQCHIVGSRQTRVCGVILNGQKNEIQLA